MAPLSMLGRDVVVGRSVCLWCPDVECVQLLCLHQDANEALVKGLDLQAMLDAAAPSPHEQIVKFQVGAERRAACVYVWWRICVCTAGAFLGH